MANVLRFRGKARRSTSAVPPAPVSPRGELYAKSARVAGKYTVSEFPRITETEVKFLQELMSDHGTRVVAQMMGVHESVALRVAANCGHRCNPDTMGAIRAFFGKCDLESVRRRVRTGRDSPQKRGPKPNATKATSQG